MKTNKEQAYLKEQNFVPSKKMGQNFLVNENLQKKITSLASIQANDYILEIGPGLGAITKWIIQITKNYVGIELDKRLYAFLKENYSEVIFINNDILKVDLTKLLNELNFSKTKVVANLPYSISSLIIVSLLKCDLVDEMTILVQKEMAERISATINTKNYNALTVLIQTFADVKTLLEVDHNNFFPKPDVKSKLIKITKKNAKIDFEKYNIFVKNCFISKRKKLINNLQLIYDKDELINLFKHLKLDLNIRAENLSIIQFTELYENLSK